MRDEKFRSEGDGANAPLCAAPIGGHGPAQLPEPAVEFLVQARSSTEPIVEKEKL